MLATFESAVNFLGLLLDIQYGTGVRSGASCSLFLEMQHPRRWYRSPINSQQRETNETLPYMIIQLEKLCHIRFINSAL